MSQFSNRNPREPVPDTGPQVEAVAPADLELELDMPPGLDETPTTETPLPPDMQQTRAEAVEGQKADTPVYAQHQRFGKRITYLLNGETCAEVYPDDTYDFRYGFAEFHYNANKHGRTQIQRLALVVAVGLEMLSDTGFLGDIDQPRLTRTTDLINHLMGVYAACDEAHFPAK